MRGAVMQGLHGVIRKAREFAPRLALFYASFMLATGAQVPFLPLWLESRGLEPRQIGVVLAAPIVVRMLVSPLVSRLSDTYGDAGRVLAMLSFGSALGFAIVFFANGFLAILAALALSAVVSTPIGAIVDAYAVRGLGRKPGGYGGVRLWGSVAFMIANICAGLLLSVIAVDYLVWVLAAAFALTGLFAINLLRLTANPPPRPNTQDTRVHFWRSPNFLVVAVAASMIQASHSIYYSFSAVAWTAHGFSGPTVGMLWALGVGAEIIFFALSGRLALQPVALILLGAAGACLRWIAMGLNPPDFLLPVLQCLHALSFGATHLGSVQFAASYGRTRQSATAQADFGSVLALGGAVATALSGLLYGAVGAHAYFVMAATAAVGGSLLVANGAFARERADTTE
jgi:PPP family 3-phenylpropionic acid transporter